MSDYHVPVLLEESIIGLDIKPEGTYIDATFGGGGHSSLILSKLGEKGRLFAFDTDTEAQANAPKDDRFTFVHANFRHIKRFMKLYGVQTIDGLLADLGVSSHQFDKGERGFSYRFDALLDMRMNQNEGTTALSIIKDYDEDRLTEMFGFLGEVKNARSLAKHIIEARAAQSIKTTGDLMRVIAPMVRGKRNKYLSQVYQALRIEVNDEINALKELLLGAYDLLSDSGKLVVISYHSLEDRLVKNYIKSGNFQGVQEKDFYGNINRPFKTKGKKIILPKEAEIQQNPRARSAKLRIASKVN